MTEGEISETGINQHSERRESNPIIEYFEKKREGLKNTIQAFAQTVRGASTPQVAAFIKDPSYVNFEQIPITENADIKLNDDYVLIPTDKRLSQNPEESDFRTLWSSSTTGEQTRTIVLKDEAKIVLPDYIVNTLRLCKNPVLLHESRGALSHEVIDQAIAAQVPNMEQATYRDMDTFLNQVSSKENQRDGVYLTTQVSAARRLMRALEMKLEQDPTAFEGVQIPNFYLEVLAEPVDSAELDKWNDILTRAFKTTPDITVVYALTEQFVVGIARHEKGRPLRYLIKPNRFVEVINKKKESVTDEVGQIVVTQLDRTAGSIYPRYNTTDLASLSIDENGDTWLSAVNRNPEKGEVNLLGYKINAQDMFNALRAEFPDIPSQIRVVVTNDLYGRGAICEANIMAEGTTPEQRQKLEEFMRQRFLDIKGYGFIWKAGNIGVIISSTNNLPEDMTKGWKVKELKREMTEQEVKDIEGKKYNLQQTVLQTQS